MIHDDNLNNCCAFEVCVTAPQCGPVPVVTVDVGFAGPGDTDLDLVGNPIGAAGQVISHVYEAPPNVPVWTVIGFQNQLVPVFGGTLVPSDAPIIVPGVTNADGELDVEFNLSTAPAGFTVYLQAVVWDVDEPQGFGFSSGLQIRKVF